MLPLLIIEDALALQQQETLRPPWKRIVKDRRNDSHA